MNSLTTSEIWTIIATVVALISSFFSYRSLVVAKKAFTLSQRQYQDKEPRFSVYLIDSFRLKSKVVKNKYLLFNVSIANIADSKNTFIPSLEIKFTKPTRQISKITLDHNPELKNRIVYSIGDLSPINLRLEEKEIS